MQSSVGRIMAGSAAWKAPQGRVRTMVETRVTRWRVDMRALGIAPSTCPACAWEMQRRRCHHQAHCAGCCHKDNASPRASFALPPMGCINPAPSSRLPAAALRVIFRRYSCSRKERRVTCTAQYCFVAQREHNRRAPPHTNRVSKRQTTQAAT